MRCAVSAFLSGLSWSLPLCSGPTPEPSASAAQTTSRHHPSSGTGSCSRRSSSRIFTPRPASTSRSAGAPIISGGPAHAAVPASGEEHPVIQAIIRELVAEPIR